MLERNTVALYIYWPLNFMIIMTTILRSISILSFFVRKIICKIVGINCINTLCLTNVQYNEADSGCWCWVSTRLSWRPLSQLAVVYAVVFVLLSCICQPVSSLKMLFLDKKKILYSHRRWYKKKEYNQIQIVV